MYFDSLDTFFLHYKKYGKQENFGVKKTNSRSSTCRKQKNLTLSCSQAGKLEIAKHKYLDPNPQTKTGWKARVDATMGENGKCRVSLIIYELEQKKKKFNHIWA